MLIYYNMLKASPANNANSYPEGFNINLFTPPLNTQIVQYKNTSEVQMLFDTFSTLNELPNTPADFVNNPYLHLKNVYFIKFPGYFNSTTNKERVLAVSGNNPSEYKLIIKNKDPTNNDDLSATWFFYGVPNSKGYIIINAKTSSILWDNPNKTQFIKYFDNPDLTDYFSDNVFFISKNFTPPNITGNVLLFSNSSLNCLSGTAWTGEDPGVPKFDPLLIYKNTNKNFRNYGLTIEAVPNSVVNPGNLYLSLIFCCGDTSSVGVDSLGKNPLGTIMSLDSGSKNRICRFMSLFKDSKDSNQALNCNNQIRNICSNKFRYDQSKPIMDVNDQSFKEWNLQSSPEAKMCHCFAPDSYYRTQYKKQLIDDAERLKTGTFSKYFNFFNSQIDNFIYARFPMTKGEYDRTVDPSNQANPFISSKVGQTFIPGRCFDETCQQGFQAIDGNQNTKIVLPTYRNLYSTSSTDNPCGGASGSSTQCNQFVFNVVTDSSASMDTNQKQQCGNATGMGATPFYIEIDPEGTCETNDKGTEMFKCKYRPDSQPNKDLCKSLYASQKGITDLNSFSVQETSQNAYETKVLDNQTTNIYMYKALNIPCTYVPPPSIPPNAPATTVPTTSPAIPTSYPTSSPTFAPFTPTTAPTSIPTIQKSNATIIIIVVVIILILLLIFALL